MSPHQHFKRRFVARVQVALQQLPVGHPPPIRQQGESAKLPAEHILLITGHRSLTRTGSIPCLQVLLPRTSPARPFFSAELIERPTLHRPAPQPLHLLPACPDIRSLWPFPPPARPALPASLPPPRPTSLTTTTHHSPGTHQPQATKHAPHKTSPLLPSVLHHARNRRV